MILIQYPQRAPLHPLAIERRLVSILVRFKNYFQILNSLPEVILRGVRAEVVLYFKNSHERMRRWWGLSSAVLFP